MFNATHFITLDYMVSWEVGMHGEGVGHGLETKKHIYIQIKRHTSNHIKCISNNIIQNVKVKY